MKKILILSANPINTYRLRLDEEVREIRSALKTAPNREAFQLIAIGATRIDDLRQTLLENNPEIVHFSGHGTGTNGLVLENTSHEPLLVNTESLSTLFELFKDQVECVLLNACYSEIQALAIYRHIDCVIGMAQPIQDDAAINFSKGFYDALFNGRDYADAFRFGCNNIDLNNIPESNTPKIQIRHKNLLPGRTNTNKLIELYTEQKRWIFRIGLLVLTIGLILNLYKTSVPTPTQISTPTLTPIAIEQDMVCEVYNIQQGYLSVRDKPNSSNENDYENYPLYNGNKVQFLGKKQGVWYYVQIIQGSKLEDKGHKGWTNSTYLDNCQY